MQIILNQLVVGELYSNEEIFKSFNVANAGGLRFRVENGSINHAVLMTSVPLARKAKENPYHDRIENGILTYTAAGREGDQTLSGMNKRLPTQLALDFPIHGFLIVANRNDKTVGPKRWQYLGLLEYVRHFPDTPLDTRGALRKVWIFEFRIHGEHSHVPIEFDQRLMSEILAESRIQNPSSEEERTVSVHEHTTSQIDPVHVEAVRSRGSVNLCL